MLCFLTKSPISSPYPTPFLIHPRSLKGGAEMLQLSGYEGNAKALIHVCRHESSPESTMLLFAKTTETPAQSARISPHRTRHMFSANMTSWLLEWKIAQRP